MDVVVVGADGSEVGARAARFAARQAGREQARLVVAHVIPWSPFTVHTAEENERRRVTKAQEVRAAKEQIVGPLVETLAAEGLQVEGVVRHGHPAETLCDLAEEAAATHVVVGRIGHSRVRSRLFGSTAGTLIQISSVPVTVVP